MEKTQATALGRTPGVETRLRFMGRSRRLGEQDDRRVRLLRPAPRATMFFPLVVVAAVLPGLYALNWWDITPPGPWWGLRGLAVRDGQVIDQLPDRPAMAGEARPGDIARSPCSRLCTPGWKALASGSVRSGTRCCQCCPATRRAC